MQQYLYDCRGDTEQERYRETSEITNSLRIFDILLPQCQCSFWQTLETNIFSRLELFKL